MVECADNTSLLLGKRLSFENSIGSIESPCYKIGIMTIVPMEDDHRCILKQVKVWFKGCKYPSCVANLESRLWDVSEVKFWPTKSRGSALLTRAEIAHCTDLVKLEVNSQGFSCDDYKVNSFIEDGVETISTHVKTVEELKNDALWKMELRTFCFDRCDLEIVPGMEITWNGKVFIADSVENPQTPRKLVKVEAHCER